MTKTEWTKRMKAFLKEGKQLFEFYEKKLQTKNDPCKLNYNEESLYTSYGMISLMMLTHLMKGSPTSRFKEVYLTCVQSSLAVLNTTFS